MRKSKAFYRIENKDTKLYKWIEIKELTKAERLKIVKFYRRLNNFKVEVF